MIRRLCVRKCYSRLTFMCQYVGLWIDVYVSILVLVDCIDFYVSILVSVDCIDFYVSMGGLYSRSTFMCPLLNYDYNEKLYTRDSRSVINGIFCSRIVNTCD